MAKRQRIVVIGAGIGGLAAAIDLAVADCDVTVVERARVAGGKMRVNTVAGKAIDSGPTVLTMRWVLDSLFAAAGVEFSDHVRLRRADILARHAWNADDRLDLYSDVRRSADEIGRFAGVAESRGYIAFSKRAQEAYESLETPFISAAEPSPLSLVLSAGLKGAYGLWRIAPFATLWQELEKYFRDPRLRQLFGRYATYCGSSPFECPATLMLVAHVERAGVWLVEGGMQNVAQAMAELGARRGVSFRYETEATQIVEVGGRVRAIDLKSDERVECEAVIVNADAAALPAGLFGRRVAHAFDPINAQPSLSAMTWSMYASTSGFPLSRHNVYFSHNYQSEFDDIFHRGLLPYEPTVYVCAQDRENGEISPGQPERLLVLVNAPACGDRHAFTSEEIRICRLRALKVLERCGLIISTAEDAMTAVTPTDFARLYPGTGGALYGQASHGWRASFTRPTVKTRIPGLYLAGGSVHPGPGVPMAALSGRIAAARLLADLPSIAR